MLKDSKDTLRWSDVIDMPLMMFIIRWNLLFIWGLSYNRLCSLLNTPVITLWLSIMSLLLVRASERASIYAYAAESDDVGSGFVSGPPAYISVTLISNRPHPSLPFPCGSRPVSCAEFRVGTCSTAVGRRFFLTKFETWGLWSRTVPAVQKT